MKNKEISCKRLYLNKKIYKKWLCFTVSRKRYKVVGLISVKSYPSTFMESFCLLRTSRITIRSVGRPVMLGYLHCTIMAQYWQDVE